MRRLLPTAFVALAVLVPSASAATKLTIRGAGFGHGIGMSQWGAYGYALHLKDYRFILGHYYTGTTLGQLSANPEVGVLLQDGHATARFSGAIDAGGQTLSAGRDYVVRRDGAALVITTTGGKRVGRADGPLRVAAPAGLALRLAGTSAPGLRDGRYRGALTISASGSGVRVVNRVDLEDYVRGVVSAESPSGWPTEALRAQAVAARTYAITSDAGGTSFDQYADTRSQVYRGVAAETPATDTAVTSTARQVVTAAGKPVTTFFFSTSGGETESIENSFIGSQPRSWLKGVEDPFDTASPRHRWGPFRYTTSQLNTKLGRYLRGGFVRIGVMKRGVSPRIVKARLIGTRGTSTISGPQLRSAFGLYDTWMTFNSVTTSVSRPTQPSASPATPAGGISPVAAAAMARAPRLTGVVSPSHPGRWIRVERRIAGRWTTAADAVLDRRGRYSVAVPARGVYRVVANGDAGPVLRVR